MKPSYIKLFLEFNENDSLPWIRKDRFHIWKGKNPIPQQDFNDIKEILERDCKPFLNLLISSNEQNSKTRSLFFRGYERGSQGLGKGNKGLYKKERRDDRRPKDTDIDVQIAIDDKFEQKFGYRLRSEGIFTTKSTSTSEQYGWPYIFFPIGDFDFFYSDTITDLFNDIESNDWYYYVSSKENRDFLMDFLEYRYGYVPEDFDDKEEYEKKLDDAHDELIDEYDTFLFDVERSYKKGTDFSEIKNQETIFICDEYYLLDPKYIEDIIYWLL